MNIMRPLERVRKALIRGVLLEHVFESNRSLSDFGSLEEKISKNADNMNFSVEQIDAVAKKVVLRSRGYEKFAFLAPIDFHLSCSEDEARLLNYVIVTPVSLAAKILLSLVYYLIFFVIYIYIQDFMVNEVTQLEVPIYFAVLGWLLTVVVMSCAVRLLLHWVEFILLPVRNRFFKLLSAEFRGHNT